MTRKLSQGSSWVAAICSTCRMPRATAGGTAGRAARRRRPWKPTRPINLIVPWAAGGATDQITRVVGLGAGEGARTDHRHHQPARRLRRDRHAERAERAPDGYTWTAGAVPDLGAYETLGTVQTRITDWHLYLSVANVSVLSVGASIRPIRRRRT